MMRLSWTQPEDLAAHALVAAHLDGVDVADLKERLREVGGSLEAPVSGATPTPAPHAVRQVAKAVVIEATARPRPELLTGAEPDGPEQLPQLAPIPVHDGLGQRLHGAWLGRAIGCLVGKPVEKIPRHGIRRIAEETGNWPIRDVFSDAGLSDATAKAFPWNRRSKPTSLRGVIDGMPEDDDLNFACLALALLEEHGDALSTDDVAQSWLDWLPPGRVFTAERIAMRNLLDGVAPETAAEVANPFIDWIGALIRVDVYGWSRPGDRTRAATLATMDARLSHRRAGVHGAQWVAAAAAAAIAGMPADEALTAGLEVVPARSRLAAAVEFGIRAARSADDDDAGLDLLHDRYGHHHWVHVLPNASLIAYSVARSEGDFARAVGLSVAGGWDTDSVGATVGGLLGAEVRVAGIPEPLRAPLHDTYRTTLAGFDGVRFGALAARTERLSTP